MASEDEEDVLSFGSDEGQNGDADEDAQINNAEVRQLPEQWTMVICCTLTHSASSTLARSAMVPSVGLSCAE